eukprot:4694044-Pleurochrysis_carterae.AAC.4
MAHRAHWYHTTRTFCYHVVYEQVPSPSRWSHSSYSNQFRKTTWQKASSTWNPPPASIIYMQ